MKRIVLICSILAALLCCAAVKRYGIDSPGSAGMVSNYDIDVADANSARLLINTDGVSTAGALKRRSGIKTVGSNAKKVYGATSVFDPTYRWKHIAGVSESTISSHSVGWLYSSDSFGLALNSAIPGNRPVYLNTYHDWLSWQGMVIHADGKSLPTLQSSSIATKKGKFSPQDSIAYSRHNVNIEAPGQLRATPLAASDSKYGCYEYRIRYRYRHGSSKTHGGYPGIASPLVCVSGQRIALSLFDHNPNPDSTGAYITRVVIERRKTDGSIFFDSFQVVDTMSFDTTQAPVYIDSLSDATVAANGAASLQWTSGAKYMPPPGAPVHDTAFSCSVGRLLTPNARSHADTASNQYRFRYSYYNPETDIESPLGMPSAYGRVWYGCDTNLAGDSVVTPVPTKWGFVNRGIRGNYIRLYRNVVTPGVVGALDTNVWYCVGTFYSDLGRTWGAFPTNYFREVISSYVGDLELAVGFNQDSANDAATALRTAIYESEITADEDGGTLMRPPLIGDIFAPFADLEYANGRFWACGDPLFTQRVYMSEIDAPNDWDVTNYLSIYEDENDQVVALEKIGSDNIDALYIFKHNGIYAVTGADPEYDMQLSTVSNSIGAASRGSVIKADNAVYFLTPAMKIYRLTNKSLDDIGYPVENWIDSVAVSYAKAVDSIRTFKLGETVNWINTATDEILTYNYFAGTFSLTQYDTGYTPIGSFIYDTAQSRAGFGYEDDWLFRSDSAKPFRIEYDALIQVDSTATDRYLAPFVYQTPFFGDGTTMVQVQEVELDLAATTASSVIISVYDQRDVAVAVDTLTTDGRLSRKYRLGVKPHIGRQLSVRVTTSALAVILGRIWCDVREVGRVPL